LLARLMGWILILAAGAGVVYATSYGFSPVSKSVEWRLFDVPPHEPLSVIADKLERMGLIRSKVCFLAAARLSGEAGHLQAGQFKLSPSMGPVDIIDKLSRGDVVTEWVVIPEGSTVQQIEEILMSHRLGKRDSFDRALDSCLKLYKKRLHLTNDKLEGYLFPDTYKVPRTMTPRDTLRMMVERFRQAVLVDLQPQIHDSQNGLSLEETITLASLVEKEAQRDDERAHIAGVLINRLRNGIKLECDATIEYALPRRKSHLSHEDVLIDSPYNTYEHRGLPPTPICNPGLASIRAALQPVSTHDLYYVAAPGGYHLFSQTLAEHDQNIKKVRAMRGSEPT
jgi:UPF0755 protein